MFQNHFILVCFVFLQSVLTLAWRVYNRYGPNNHMGVSYAAHVGGAIAGETLLLLSS